MSDRPDRKFVDTFVENIDDDLPRLVYADWLDENGRAERAEFVRVQVERARLPAWDAAQVRLALRERALLDAHGEEWLAEMPAIEGARWEGFRRGVVAEVRFASFQAMRKSAAACRAVAPVEAVSVRWPQRREGRKSVKPIAELRELTLTGEPDYESFAWLAESPQLATLRRLTASRVWAYETYLRPLFASPHLVNLRSLRLPLQGLGNRGFTYLAGASTFTALEELDLTSCARNERYDPSERIRAESVRTLMGWAGLATVRSLNLSGNDLNAAGLRALLRSPYAAGLKELRLRDTRLTGAAMAEFASAVEGLSLDVLDLGQNLLRAGAESVAAAPCLGELKSLRLDRCEVPAGAAKSFAETAAFVGTLRSLDVGYNHFGAAGLAALLDRAPAALHTLDLRDNDLFDKGAALLAGSPASDGLVAVDLARNGLGPAAAAALADAPHLRGLLVLRLADNPLGLAAPELAASPLGRRLAVLELEPGDARVPEPRAMPSPSPNPFRAAAPPPSGGDDIPF